MRVTLMRLWNESVNALPKVVGFLRFPPTGNVDRVGWDYLPNWPFHRSCAPWSDMSHKVAARNALRKPSTRSDWAASFTIQLSFILTFVVFHTCRRWRFSQICIRLLSLLVRCDVDPPTCLVKLFTDNLVHDSLAIRKVSLQFII
jgi:hypothetical protein